MLWNKLKGKRRGSALGWGTRLTVRALGGCGANRGDLDEFQETGRPEGRRVWLPLQMADIV